MPKIVMMYAGLVLTIAVFSAVALFLITRPNFRLNTQEEQAIEPAEDE